MKEITLQKLSFFCLLIQTTFANLSFSESIDLVGDNISIISFLIILVANWRKVVAQLKSWFK